jgi:hypothetical protein
MIEKLTEQQEAQIPEYKEKWINKASEKMNHEKAYQSVMDVYSSMDLDAPKIIIGESPKHTRQLASLFWAKFNKRNDSDINFDTLQSDLIESLPFYVNDPAYKKLANETKDDWYLSFWWMSWAGWYDFAKYIGVKFDENTYNTFVNFCSDVHFIIPYEGIAFISEKPTAIHWENDLLHKDGEKAVEYSDGYCMYFLNGVRVSEYLATTPEEQLDIQKFHDIKNADERTEFVRKYGIDRMLEFGKKIDSYENYNDEWFTKSEYELYDMAELFEGVEYAPHIKMTNQTTGVYHVEAVSPKCNTIYEALKERFGGRDFSTIRSIA